MSTEVMIESGPRPVSFEELWAAGIDRQSAAPMYEQLRKLINDSVRSGQLVAGDLLPGELRLCELLQISRTVVRQAMAELENEGLVERVKGKGTFVAVPKTPEILAHTLSGLHEEMAQLGRTVLSTVIANDVVRSTVEVARELGITPGAQVVRLERLRLVDGEPWSLATTWMPMWVGEAVIGLDMRTASLYSVLAEHGIRVVGGERSAEATVATPAQAELLEVRPGAALLKLRSLGVDQENRPVEYFVAFHRGDRSRFAFTLGGPSSVAKLEYADGVI